MAGRQVFYQGNLGNPYTLKEGNDLFILRLKKSINPNQFLKSVPGIEKILQRVTRRASFHDSNAHVYEHNGGEELRDEIKRAVRNKGDEDLDFIGSVFKYDHSGIYQIYTGNVYLELDPAMSEKQITKFFKLRGLQRKNELNFGHNIFFCEANDYHNKEIFNYAEDLLNEDFVLCCHPELITDLNRDLYSQLHSESINALPSKWWSDKINLEEAWKTTKGKGATIAILDDGLDRYHKAFSNRIYEPLDMMDKRRKRFPSHQYGQKHGTPCASIAVSRDAKAIGVAPESKLMPIRIGGLGSVLQSEGICLAVKNGADVISCSWGPPDGNISDPSDNEKYFPLPDHTRKAFEFAITKGRKGKGTPIVFAAGNGKEPIKFDGYAAAEEVVTVAASNYKDEATVYSDYGFPVDCCFPSGDYEITKHGRAINHSGIVVADRTGKEGYSKDDYYSIFSGTSASCPGVAGILALMISANSSITWGQLKSSFSSICQKIGNPEAFNKDGYSQKLGYGLIDAKQAVDYAQKINSKSLKKRTMSKTKKNNSNSLHIGINYVDNNYYHGEVPDLDGCVNDMNNMKKMADEIGYNSHTLKNELATKENIRQKIVELGNNVNDGGILFVTYAGHGARIPNTNEALNDNENDGKDESWVTYDGFLLDDDIFNSLAEIENKIRVVVLSDSCHSETTTRLANFEGYKERKVDASTVSRILSFNDQTAVELRSAISSKMNHYKATVINLSACLQNETAKEINGEGVFSKTIREVYEELKHKKSGNYISFINEVSERVNDIIDQVPNYSLSHVDANSSGFLKQFPFSIGNDYKEKNYPSPSLGLEESNNKLYAASTGELLISYNGSSKSTEIINNERASSSSVRSAWAKAYQHAIKISNQHIGYIEPNIISNLYLDGNKEGSRSSEEEDEYLKTYPPFFKNEKDEVDFIWHLREEFTGLKKANEIVFPEIRLEKKEYNKCGTVRIAHIDTGIIASHPASPININGGKRFSLTKAEETAIDKEKLFSLTERQGHGQATIALLAGGYVDYEHTENRYQGFFGAIPYAEIIPIKISDTVVLITGRNFAKAIDFAIEKECDVITMSMAGLPSRVMAEAVDKAYEKGIVIVSAAGNCWSKGIGRAAPKKSLYPARYDRVIAAVGATYDKLPYINKLNKERDAGGLHMQSCYGPKRVLKTSVAAFTPNVTWFGDDGKPYSRAGGGTSSATPQIAAAAALYIQKHRDELKKYKGTWQHAEIVRQAIFKSSDNSSAYTDEYFGNGILNAITLLEDRLSPDAIISDHIIKVENQETAMKQRGHGRFKLFHLYSNRSLEQNISTNITNKEDFEKIISEMLMTELHQLIYVDPALHIFQDIDLDQKDFDINQYPDLKRALKQSSFASFNLKESLKSDTSNETQSEGSKFASVNLRPDETIIESELGYTKVSGKGLNIRVYNTQSYIEGEGDNIDFVIDEFEIDVLDSHRDIRSDAVVSIQTRGDMEQKNENSNIHSELIIESVFEDMTVVRLNWNQEFVTVKSRTQNVNQHSPGRNNYQIPYGVVRKRGIGKKLLRLVVKVVKWVIPKIEDSIPKTPKKRKELLHKISEKLGDKKYEIVVFDLNSNFNRSNNNWKPISKQVVDQIKSSNKEVLLFVPGLMSSVENGFKEFLDNKSVTNQLSKSYCQYVIGINMPSVLQGIEKNSKYFDEHFKNLGFVGKKCKVIARSRGGIVARHLFEINWLNSEKQKPSKKAPFHLQKLFMTGSPNQGTRIASSSSWESLFNTMLNFSKTTLGKVIPVLPGVICALKALSAGFVELPGIDDLDENSEIITLLNRTEAPRKNYWSVTSNYEPNSFLKKLFDERIVDRSIFKGQQNDLITPCDGAVFQNDDFQTEIELDENQILLLRGEVGHFGYLKSKHGVVNEILKLL